MKTAVFSTKPYDRQFLEDANRPAGHELVFLEAKLAAPTARLAEGFPAVCAFVNDQLDDEVLSALASGGTRLITMRCSGFNNVDLRAADRLGLTVARVPAYSPHAVAEHTVGLILMLARKLHKAYNRVREGNLSLEGLLGIELASRTCGIVGTGKIGEVVARILHGFGCRLLAFDVRRNPNVEAIGVDYVPIGRLMAESDVITLHCPLVPDTYHLIGAAALTKMKDGVVLINTSRGKLIDTEAVVEALKSGRIGALGLDVYEEEADLFYEDLSSKVIQDDVFMRMLTFPNVVVTGHQAFFTDNALKTIGARTIENITAFAQDGPIPGLVTVDVACAPRESGAG